MSLAIHRNTNISLWKYHGCCTKEPTRDGHTPPYPDWGGARETISGGTSSRSTRVEKATCSGTRVTVISAKIKTQKTLTLLSENKEQDFSMNHTQHKEPTSPSALQPLAQVPHCYFYAVRSSKASKQNPHSRARRREQLSLSCG